MFYTNTFRQSTGQGGMDDIRREQSQSQKSSHIGVILADCAGKFNYILKLTLVYQSLPAVGAGKTDDERIGKGLIRVRSHNPLPSGAAPKRHRYRHLDVAVFKRLNINHF